MLRKTAIERTEDVTGDHASMRPQRNAAENGVDVYGNGDARGASMRPQRNAAENQHRMVSKADRKTLLQ